MALDQNLVREINRLYHEEEAKIYDEHHPEIFTYENAAWQSLARFLPQSATGRRIVDIGTGTGFVFEALMPFLTAKDIFTATDLSQTMLARTKEKFAGRSITRFEFAVCDAEHLPFTDSSADVLTINSVLHHLPDTGKFFIEADRLLKSGGVILIAHEPSQIFWKNPLLRLIVWGIGKWRGVRKRLQGLVKQKSRISTSASSHDAYEAVYQAVNAQLLRQKLISKNLTPEEIQSYVDVHSPTATGTPDSQKGFIPWEFPRQYLPGYRVIYLSTSAHLGKYSVDAKGIAVVFEKMLRALFPQSGSSFAVALQKP